MMIKKKAEATLLLNWAHIIMRHCKITLAKRMMGRELREALRAAKESVRDGLGSAKVDHFERLVHRRCKALPVPELASLLGRELRQLREQQKVFTPWVAEHLAATGRRSE